LTFAEVSLICNCFRYGITVSSEKRKCGPVLSILFFGSFAVIGDSRFTIL